MVSALIDEEHLLWVLSGYVCDRVREQFERLDLPTGNEEMAEVAASDLAELFDQVMDDDL